MRILFVTVLLFSLSTLKAQVPTWSDNIACILYTNCTGCHNANGIAPSSFINYQQTLPYRNGIKVAVNEKLMPPFPPDVTYREYAHQRVLTEHEIDLINLWVDNGAPEGNTANLPTPPVYNSNIEITAPDMELQMPEYTVPVTNDIYRCFVLPTNLATDMFMTGIEVVPGNVGIVHHVLVYADNSNVPAQLDANDPGPGYTSFGGTGSNNSVLIGGWVPGQAAVYYPQNFGVKLNAGTNIIIQVHYPRGTLGEKDSTKLLFKLSNASPSMRELNMNPILNHGGALDNGPLVIPENEVKTFYSSFTSPIKGTIMAVGPHMHLIGKSIKAFAVTPLNDTIKLINIPKWDFHWQGSYFFKQPVIIPAGSTIYGEAVYDNTSNNPFNPSNPPQQVTVGESTTDEMMLIYFTYTLYQQGDENVVIDTSSKKYYNDCEFRNIVTSNAKVVYENIWSNIFPNPAKNILNITSSDTEILITNLYDNTGKLIFTDASPSNHIQINTEHFQAGIYFLELKTDNGITKKKVFIE